MKIIDKHEICGVVGHESVRYCITVWCIDAWRLVTPDYYDTLEDCAYWYWYLSQRTKYDVLQIIRIRITE